MNAQYTLKVDTRNLLAIELLENLGNQSPTQSQIDFIERFLSEKFPTTDSAERALPAINNSNIVGRTIARHLQWMMIQKNRNHLKSGISS